MMNVRSLPVLMPAIAGQRWSCHSCGNCCRTLVEHVTDAERRRIVEQGWAKELGVEPVVRSGRSWVLNKRADGACVFLDEENRCRIHARFGAAAKPLACRVFPFSVRPTRNGWRASLRFDCPSATASKGEPIGAHRAWLGELVGELTPEVRTENEVVLLKRSVRADSREVDELMRRLRHWLDDADVSMTDRLVGAARVTSMLAGAKLKKVRGSRFADLVDLLFETLPGEIATAPETPAAKQRGMLRQAAFAHAEHVTLAELRSGVFGRLRERWMQLRSARRFLKGGGVVPAAPGLAAGVAFAAVESVGPADERPADVEDLLHRYLTARIEGDTVFGAGYYGWPVLDGLAALWLSIAAAGWLARHEAAAEQRERVSFADVATALGVVDRAATRLPALGTWAERARLSFLVLDDGLARLLRAYALVKH